MANFFVFRTDYASRTWLWEEMTQKGRLRQGWALAGTSLLDDRGNIQSEDEWIGKCWPTFKRAWKDFTKNGAAERYKILKLMLQIQPGDFLIVPKMPEDDKFVLVRAHQNPARIGRDAPCYDFDENPNPHDDFRHQVFVDPESVREFSWKSLPGAAGEKRLQFYQKAVNQVKDEMLQKTIKGLDDRNAANRTEAEPAANLNAASLPNESPDTPEHLHHFLEEQRLHFSYELVANYLLALQTKKFVILTGLSGTGKSQLAIAIAKYFEPNIPTSEVVRIPEGCEVIELRPYMFQHNRMTLPATIRSQMKLPSPDEGTKGGGQLAVSYPGGKETLAFWRDPDSKGNNLFFKGSFKEWFTTNLKPGQKLILQVVDGDAGQPDSLKISIPETEVRQEPLRNRCVVAVRPDWTDNRGLLGYFNPLTNRYSIEGLLKLLLRAEDEMSAAVRESRPPNPFFAILDEMNLAHVEQYFSDFLSCLESGERLNLHQEMRLAFLAPRIVEAIAEGCQPADLSAIAMTQRIELPPLWSAQQQALDIR